MFKYLYKKYVYVYITKEWYLLEHGLNGPISYLDFETDVPKFW